MIPDHQSSRRRPAPASSGRGRPAPARTPTRDAARHVAYSYLAEIAARFPDLDPRAVPDQGLAPRDAAFAHAIVHASLQRWLTLVHVVQRFLARPFADLEPALRGVFIGGSAQLLLLDKVPVHAAINESVEWAKSVIRPGAGGMVNAVLRKVAGLLPEGERASPAWSDRRDELLLADGSARRLTAPLLPEDSADRLSIMTSHPAALVRSWLARYGPTDGPRLLLHSLANPPIVLNVGPPGESPSDPSLTPHTAPGHFIFGGNRDDLRRLLERRPGIWVQDAASSEAVQAAGHLKPRFILDLCAGQGTKTRQLARVFPQAQIVASDTDADRFQTLKQVFAGSSQVRTCKPAELRAMAGRADLILLDVPCSNTGVLARRVEAKYRLGPKQMTRLVQIQRSIIEAAAPLLAPAGRLLYSTCSLEPEENEQQAAWAAHRFGLTVEKSALTLPAGVPGDPPAVYRDGSFYAVLARSG